ncbi:hypothetical protein KQI36_14630 [Clostridium senegalense]|uniref:hypothetical protein n=1 Tax=Clostridium senegalense TaxID=1465809 RepID=UPI001C10B698|nr:hypothetical protein [Clostridium senegalense]MBU5227867.1 hypothetical protein [Clostridium senegalense]
MRNNGKNGFFIVFRDKNNKTINKFLLTSIIIAVSYILTSNIPEIFKGGENLYNLINNLSLAYIASYIFYAITIYYPNNKRKRKLHKYLFNNIVSLYKLEESLIDTILKYDEPNDIELEKLKEEDLIDICMRINPHVKVDCNIRLGKMDFEKSFGNYFEMLNYFHEESKNIILKLMILSEYLSDDVMALLTDIEDNFNNHLNLRRGDIIKNPNMQIYMTSLWRLYKEYNELLAAFNDDSI